LSGAQIGWRGGRRGIDDLVPTFQGARQVVGGGWYGTGIAKVVSVELHGAGVSHIGQSLEVGLVVVGALVERLDAAGPVVVVDILRIVVGAADRRERQIRRHRRDDSRHTVAIPFFQLVAEVN